MKPARELSEVTYWMLTQLNVARSDLAASLAASDRDQLARLTFLAVDLHNCLRTFLRCYYLSSALGALDSNGNPVTTTIGATNAHDALVFAQTFNKKTWGEPAWHDVDMMIRLFKNANCSNLFGFSAAWSIGSKAPQELTAVRNFFAHRVEGTALKVRNIATSYLLPSPINPGGVLLMKAANRPQALVEDWLDDLEVIVQLMPA